MIGPANPPCVTYSRIVEGRRVVVSSNHAEPGFISIRVDGAIFAGTPRSVARAIVEGIDRVEAEIAAAGGAL
jgi:hypothetical protein